MGALLARARDDMGPGATLELSREILHELECSNCDEREAVFLSLGKVTEDDARCARCGEVRFPHLTHGVDGTSDFMDRSPAEMGLPPFDIIVARSDLRAVGYLLAGDEVSVLGAVAPADREEAGQAAGRVDCGAKNRTG